MRYLSSFLFILLLSSSFAANTTEIPPWLQENPLLGHYLSLEEYLQSQDYSRAFYPTDPPEGPVHNIAEFEPMQAVLIRYPFGIPYNLIAEMSQDTKVLTIVTGSSQETTVTGQYNSYGVNLDNCEFLYAPTDSYWTRDYGPWFIIDGNNEFGIVNFRYNRPRPNDNDIPIEVAEYLNINLFGMDVYTAGGNYMADGLGIAASSDLIFAENGGQSQEQIRQKFSDYLGIHTYHVLEDPNNTYIDHIDCWGKYLDYDKVLIRSVAPSHSQYDELEEVADYFSQQISSYGTPYQVFRVYTPQNQPYTNSLILNRKVFVPVTGSEWDDEAIASYQEAMPGYEVLGFTGSWESTDALHCRTKGIADLEMLYIRHIPIEGEQPAEVEFTIEADIIPYSGAELIADSLLIFYSINNADFQSIPLVHASGTHYLGTIPPQGDGAEIRYYLLAVDEAGRRNTHPYIGVPDAHLISIIQYPEIQVDIDQISLTLGPASWEEGSFHLANSGGGLLEYTIRTVETTGEGRDMTGSQVSCSAEEYEPGTTVIWTFTVFNGSPDNEWITDVTLDFPQGVNVISAQDFTGGSGGNLVYDGITGDGVIVNWQGETAMGYGVIHGGESASAAVEVSLEQGMVHNLLIDYQISGDEYGSEPHVIIGSITIAGLGDPAEWITIDPVSGNLTAGESAEIFYTISATDLEAGVYTCDIIISGNAVNEVVIPVELLVTPTSSQDEELSLSPQLLGNYPNPFNPETEIRFILPTAGYVTIEIFNLKGEKVKDINSGLLPAGQQSLVWNGRDEQGKSVPSGIYFYRLQANPGAPVQKMILLK